VNRNNSGCSKFRSTSGVDKKQFSLLDEFADKAAAHNAPPEEKNKPSFLSSLGLTDKMNNAGINSNNLLKGLLGIAGPVVLGSMLSGAMGRRGYGHRRNFGMGGLGGGMMPAAGPWITDRHVKWRQALRQHGWIIRTHDGPWIWGMVRGAQS
jgi:hypothetical protein